MHRESKCQHDIDEQETAVAEHLCPLCLDVKVAELELLRKSAIKLWYEEQTRRQEAEAKLEAAQVLADSWMGTWAETCADELEALLK